LTNVAQPRRSVVRLSFVSDLDPKTFAVNKRFLSNRALPPEVRKAKEALAEEASMWMVIQNPGWKQGAKDFYEVAMDFVMTDRRNDVDGPSKRILDAIAHGAGISDSRVQELTLRRFRGSTPAIFVTIESCDPRYYDVTEE
jgi:Holliday junction resolvase RusA-like endonuclease